SQAKVDTDFLAQNIHLLIGGIVLAFAIGYGLASKNTMANFLASFYIKNKVNIGQTITLDDLKGKVTEIDKSTLTIVQESGEKVLFPLSRLNQTNIIIHN
ncbi:MAG: mechanosensitive ion channel family protein, partial [Bacteroidia bacterium]|nr:mechanosensitive ion channel family protein [Bacteroidia bacterium]